MAQAKQERPTPEQIQAAYKAKLMTAGERNDKLRRLAYANLEDIIEDQGIVLSYFTETLKHVQTQWDDFVKMAEDYKPANTDNSIVGGLKESAQTLKMAAGIVWNTVGMLVAPLTAFQEVNGATARRWAQDKGASPGLAAVIGTVANVGSGFVPVGKLSQAFARAVQKNVPQLAAGVKKISGKSGDVEAAAKVTAQAEKLANESVAKGLVEDGVKLEGLEGFVDDTAALLKETRALPTPDDFYKALRKYHDEIKDVTETVHIKDLAKEADKLGVTVDDLRNLGREKQLTPAQTMAYLKALDEPTEHIIDNARKVIRGDPDAGLIQDRLMAEYFSYTPEFRRLQHTSGLAVKVQDMDPRMKSITNMMAAWDPVNMSKLDLRAARLTIAEDWLALADEAEKLKALQISAIGAVEKGSPTFWAKVREGFVGLLLLRPVTWTRQLVGNSVAAVTHLAEKELAGWITIDEAKGIVKHEGIHTYLGMQAATAEAFKAFGDAYRRNPQAQTRLDFPIHQIGGAFGRAINFGSDTVMGFDQFFKALSRNSEIYAAAFRGAMRSGLEPGSKEFVDYVTRRRMNPTAETKEAAEATALMNTFQQELGTFGQTAKKLLQWGPLALYNPFMKSPINLVKWGWNHTPGLQMFSKSLYDDILAGGTRADMAIARLTLSNVFGQFVYGMVQQGLYTGGGPTDPALRRSWLATHQPYSAKSGNDWLPLSNTAEPGTTPVEMIADFAEIRNQLDDPTAEQTWSAIGLTVARNILDNTWWRSMGQLVDITAAMKSGEEVGKLGAQLLFSPIIAVTTGGPLGQVIERNIDPIRRETRSWIDNLRNGVGARVLGYSKDAPPIRDGYGDPIVVPQALGSGWLRRNMPIGGELAAGINNAANPFVSVLQESNRIKQEGARLQIKMPPTPWSLGGKAKDDFDIRAALPGDELPVELSAKERDRWDIIKRNLLRHSESGIEAGLLNTPEYQGATWARQRDLFMDAMATYRAQAKGLMIAENKELQAKAIKADAAKVLPLLHEAERPALEAQTGEALDLIESLDFPERENLIKWGALDTGEERDKEVINKALQLEITKPIADLNAAVGSQSR